MILKTLGKNPSGKRLEKIKTLPNYTSQGFTNESPTEMMAPGVSYFTVLRDFIFKKPGHTPNITLPSKKSDLKNLDKTKNSLVWFGHSSYLLNLKGYNILVDPVLSGSASPFSTMVKAFKGTDIYTADDFPEIDLLLITHDHYDHLDHRFFLKIKNKVKFILTSVGVGEHLEYWGYPKEKIKELNWGDETEIDGIEFHCAPARHFSGRSFVRNKTLWSSFILNKGDCKLYLGGDSGYDAHFKKIGEKFGPFDLVMLECGQYNTAWPQIHMMPEQTVQAAVDLRAKQLLPVHWAKFSLALHGWKEPAERVWAEAEKRQFNLLTPLIGEEVEIGSGTTGPWWQSVRA